MTASDILHYRIGSRRPRAHLFDVELRIPATALSSAHAEPRTIELSLPAWIPGSYMIRDFARHVVDLHAKDTTGTLAIAKIDKQTWRLTEPKGEVQVHYRVHAGELSVRTAHLDQTHGYFNGACLFLQVSGCEHWPCSLDIDRPVDPCADTWRVATSLPSAGGSGWQFGRYQAANYEDLIDHPVEMGDFSLIEFSVQGVPHAVAISGRHRCDSQRLGDDLARICTQQAALFGELPIDRYLFLTQVVGTGYGGLEHRSSCSLICNRADLPQPGQTSMTEGYRRFLGLCSHEYFHLWNVKRIRPQVFVDHQLQREVHTRLLWAFEGITSYYDDLALVRAGLISPQDYLALLAKTLNRVLRDPGRHRQTLAESSFDAWTKFYQPDANSPNAIVSYYAKGAMIALALDLTIRQRSRGRHSLDTFMRALWERYGCTGQGVPEHAPEALAKEVTGLDLDAFFAQALNDTQDIDLHPLFDTLGIQMRLRPAKDAADLGGADNPSDSTQPKPSIGVRLQTDCTEARLAVVLNNRPAERAGLAPGDILIAIDSLRVDAATFEPLLARCPIGEPVTIHAFRRDELDAFDVIPEAAPTEICDLYLIDNAPNETLAARAAWLHINNLNRLPS